MSKVIKDLYIDFLHFKVKIYFKNKKLIMFHSTYRAEEEIEVDWFNNDYIKFLRRYTINGR